MTFKPTEAYVQESFDQAIYFVEQMLHNPGLQLDCMRTVRNSSSQPLHTMRQRVAVLRFFL